MAPKDAVTARIPMGINFGPSHGLSLISQDDKTVRMKTARACEAAHCTKAASQPLRFESEPYQPAYAVPSEGVRW